MNILLLGGIAESKALAKRLIERGDRVIYSIVGLVRTPSLDCEVRTGGFSREGVDGVDGMAEFCSQRNIELIVDASHPYAEDISAHAMAAASVAGIECWRYLRPGWNADNYAGWYSVSSMDELWPLLSTFRRPFFTIGASALDYTDQRLPQQHWIVRTAQSMPQVEGVTQVNRIGPFYYDDEISLMAEYAVDAVVSKDSGCQRVAAKLDAARDRKLPVFIITRPELVDAHCEFSTPDLLVDALCDR
ncbi:MAG: precorrin-6A/cobalt-precorrin-6A reductase [Pseudomonadota bacterium]